VFQIYPIVGPHLIALKKQPEARRGLWTQDETPTDVPKRSDLRRGGIKMSHRQILQNHVCYHGRSFVLRCRFFALVVSVSLLTSSCLKNDQLSGSIGSSPSINLVDEKTRFDNYLAVYATGTMPFSVYATDLDGDGDADLLSVDFASNQISILFNHTND
jgi:hypothetical protein